MTQFSLVAAAAMLSASLFGCGPAPAPTPDGPYAPTTVDEAWANHLGAFGGQDLEKIMYDYDSDSVLQVYNDGCSPGVLREFVGDGQIRGFFQELFTTLAEHPVIVPDFTDDSANPTVDNAEVGESFDAANVFLVWKAPDSGIEKATDTFMWKQVGPLPGYVTATVKVKKQNIVVTETCPSSPAPSPAAPVYDVNSTVAKAWDNHLAAFGEQDRTKILLDYSDSSRVQVWNWGMAEGEGYTKYEGLTEIGDMFDALWQQMNAQQKDGDIGLAIPDGFPRVEVDLCSVFLVWSSYSHPKATDTFLFDMDGKILRQTIVSTNGTAPSRVQEIAV